MRSTITLLIGLSTLLLFISIHSISYVNAQSALNYVSLDNKSTNANSAVESKNLDPFTLRESSNDASTVNNNDQATDAEGGSSTSSSNDDNKDASTSSSNDKDDDDNKGSDGDKSSKEDKKSDSKDDKKFELPFP
ncbi:MAG: hypothetical protein QOA13_00245 [Nitrososphaeraceae archaeon]|nr:hypothetical protein [Nitrososphaeraceae archaeon]MDW0257372.1 hypothetical protein [Nitrososphaeraceae archaeon]MDW0308184.1 hypothetical protein [Nitrososphaeraceae archaeon]